MNPESAPRAETPNVAMQVRKLSHFLASCSLCPVWTFRYGHDGTCRADAEQAFTRHVAAVHR